MKWHPLAKFHFNLMGGRRSRELRDYSKGETKQKLMGFISLEMDFKNPLREITYYLHLLNLGPFGSEGRKSLEPTKIPVSKRG